MTYIPLSVINSAIGSEADGFVTVTQIANDIIYDKTVLTTALNNFGVPASETESLIDLINKVIPLSVNYIIALSDLFATQTFTGVTDSLSVSLHSTFTVPLSEDFNDADVSYTSVPENGDFWLGGDATDTTRSIPFVVTAVPDSTHLQVISTVGMQYLDSLTQGVNTTSIVTVIDGQNLLVGDTTGWVPYTLAASF